MQLSFDFDSPAAFSQLNEGRLNEAVEARLAAALHVPCRVVFTENRRVMVSARRKLGFVCVRLHRLFRRADEETVGDVAKLLRSNDPEARERLREFLRSQRGEAPQPRLRHRLRTRGKVHDLLEILESLRARYGLMGEGPVGEEPVGVVGANDDGPGPIDGLRITWGRRTAVGNAASGFGRRRRIRKCIQLGVYLPSERLIRVHTALDQSWVPRYYVESVVHHELLHHLIPAVRIRGRDHVHTAEFRRREAAFEHHERARRWEIEHLDRLLQS